MAVESPLPTRARLPELLSALESAQYRWVWLTGMVGLAGTTAHSVAEGWLILELTGSATAVGLVTSLFAAPMTALMLVGGVVADAFDRRRILIAANVIRMALAASLAVLAFQGLVRPWHLYVVALGMGTCLAFAIPAYQALLPLLVPANAVHSAYALQATSMGAASALGRSAGGIMVAALGVATTFAFNVLTHLAPLLAFWRLKVPPQQAQGLTRGGTWRDLGEGLLFLAQRRKLLWAVLLSGAAWSLSMAVVIQAPVFASQALGQGPMAVGFLTGSWFAGSVLGSLASGQAGSRFDPLRLLTGAGALSSVALVAYGLAPTLETALGACFASGALVGAMGVTQSAFLVQATPARLRGRIMSAGVFAQAGPMPLTMLLVGLAGDAVGIRAAIVGTGAALGLGVVILWGGQARPAEAS